MRNNSVVNDNLRLTHAIRDNGDWHMALLSRTRKEMIETDIGDEKVQYTDAETGEVYQFQKSDIEK